MSRANAAMPAPLRIRSVRFRNFKAFKKYTLWLDRFNVLVGPNNAGKSTIITAFRILHEGIRRANARKAELVPLGDEQGWGYPVSLDVIPIAIENIFHNYDDSEPATVKFELSTRDSLTLVFPALRVCSMIIDSQQTVRSPSDFRRVFPLKLGVVPVLGHLEHEEELNQKEVARDALIGQRAAMNFRNLWYHYPEGFQSFRELIQSSWPGMDVQAPEVSHGQRKPVLRMFCPEKRIPREIYWAGFGFQVWCQILTFVAKLGDSTLLIIDEPDVYLHSDLQRQLIHILRELSACVLIATHSVELIGEASSGEVVLIDKSKTSSERLDNPWEFRTAFHSLGSNFNPILTQVARTRRVLFVEGKDFLIFSRFAQKLGYKRVATRADFAVVCTGGFNPQKTRDFMHGVRETIGPDVIAAAVFDRDYREQAELDDIQKRASDGLVFCRVHSMKEIENYLLIPRAIAKSVVLRLQDREAASPRREVEDFCKRKLNELQEEQRHLVYGQFAERVEPMLRRDSPSDAKATTNSKLSIEFDRRWNDPTQRLAMIPGKTVLSLLCAKIQHEFGVSISAASIVESMTRDDVPEDIQELMRLLEAFRLRSPSEPLP